MATTTNYTAYTMLYGVEYWDCLRAYTTQQVILIYSSHEAIERVLNENYGSPKKVHTWKSNSSLFMGFHGTMGIWLKHFYKHLLKLILNNDWAPILRVGQNEWCNARLGIPAMIIKGTDYVDNWFSIIWCQSAWASRVKNTTLFQPQPCDPLYRMAWHFGGKFVWRIGGLRAICQYFIRQNTSQCDVNIIAK